VPKASLLLLPVVLTAAIASAQMGEASREAEPNFANAVPGSALTCSQSHTLIVPPQLVARARVKVKLLTLLRESLYDDARGVVNIAREKEIRKLANKLKNESND
jgi:hypothetical protein